MLTGVNMETKGELMNGHQIEFLISHSACAECPVNKRRINFRDLGLVSKGL